MNEEHGIEVKSVVQTVNVHFPNEYLFHTIGISSVQKIQVLELLENLENSPTEK